MADIFSEFKILKKQYRLGESKYKIKVDTDELSKTQEDRYLYTFRQVIEEAKDYGLVEEHPGGLTLTSTGDELLRKYDKQDVRGFNITLFQCMESKHGTFRQLIELLYAQNRNKPGLLILPSYSPRQLHFERSNVQTTADVTLYSLTLVRKLEDDIQTFLGQNRTLSSHNQVLLTKLKANGLLPDNPDERFENDKYNVIIKRFRDFWISYFLKEVYNYDISLTAFDRWIYRGKQIGIIYATEFYPNFNGRIVYPTSVVIRETSSRDFTKLYSYSDGFGLYVHEPFWDEEMKNKFVKALVNAYFDLRRSNRSYFINLLALRELVCYALKISEDLFARYLGEAYKLNLAGALRIKFSLEVDKLPEETKAPYLKQEPVMVDGKYRNIIAIDVTRGQRFHEQPV